MKKVLLLILVLTATLLLAENVRVSSDDFSFEVVSSTDNETVLELNFGEFQKEAVNIEGETFYRIGLAQESVTYEAGAPELPKVTRSLIIPDAARMSVEVLSSDYTDFELKIAPSKGHILRNIDPITVPYTFSNVYSNDAFYPEVQAGLTAPYILRDFRGITLNTQPFSYNPVTENLRVYHNLTIRVFADGSDTVNVKNRVKENYSSYFEEVYANRFINFSTNTRYDLVDDQGRMIVIAPAEFMEAAQPYVDWKIQKGFQVDVYDVADIGNASAIQTFIQSQYDLNDDLTFVQIFGDGDQVPSLSSGGGAADPKFATVDGADDYLDIFIGRFSAETVAHVESQVLKTIWYERDLGAEDWLAKGLGIASTQGAGTGDDGEADNVHMDLIRTKLMEYGYTDIDQVYDPSANSSAVAASVNAGRGIINYVGHGSTTSWVSSGFSNSHVNQLTNDYMYPFINSVACVNGDFIGNTCFAEAWLRATNNETGAPTGAIVMFASSINQSWAPPMCAEDEAIDMITGNLNYEGTPDIVTTIGGLWYNCEGQMLEQYGANDMSETWHIFGDASLFFRTKVSETMTISHLPTILVGQTSFDVNTGVENAQVAFYHPTTGLIATGFTDASGAITLPLENAPTEPTDLTLTITAKNKITSVETIAIVPADGPYVVFNEYAISDAAGNNNGLADYAETFNLDFTVGNVGVGEATNVEVTISTTSEFVTVNNATASFGNIETAGTANVTDAFELTVINTIPDGEVVMFEVNAVGQESWASSFSITLHAPVLEYAGLVIDDSAGNGNGRLDPGETANFVITLMNSGSSTIMEVMGELISADPLITISNTSANFGGLAPDETSSQNYTVSASSSISGGYMAAFDFAANTTYNYGVQNSFETQIGGYLIDEEFSTFPPEGWTIEGGENWVAGAESSAGGTAPEAKFYWSPSLDGIQRLISDVVNTSGTTSLELEFKHAIDDYDGSGYEMRVETTSDGTTWNTINTYSPADLAAVTENFTLENEDVGSATFQLAFTFDGNSYNVNSWTVDDVILGSGDAPQFSQISGTVTLDVEEIDVTQVTISTGTLSTNPDASGYYSFSVNPGTYDVQAQLPGYFTISENVIVAAEETITQDFSMNMIEIPSDLAGNFTIDEITVTWNHAAARALASDLSSKKIGTRETRDFSYFNVYGAIEDGPFEIIGTPTETTLTHNRTNGVVTYSYYVTAVYDDGLSESLDSAEMMLEVTDANDPSIPAITALNGNYPNPFNPTTKISYSLSEAQEVVIDIFNGRGQKVKTLVNQHQEAGRYTTTWNGDDNNNKSVASGLYFYKMQTTRHTSTKKMILLK